MSNFNINNCADCKDKLKCGFIMNVSSTGVCYCLEHKKMKNSDRIRAMSDEELAEYLFNSGYLLEEDMERNKYGGITMLGLFKWLQSEAKESEE